MSSQRRTGERLNLQRRDLQLPRAAPGALAAAFAADPMLPGMIGLLPSPYACAAFLLDVNEWLSEYKIGLV